MNIFREAGVYLGQWLPTIVGVVLLAYGIYGTFKFFQYTLSNKGN